GGRVRSAGGETLRGGAEKRHGPGAPASPGGGGGRREPGTAIGVEERRQRPEGAGVIAVEPSGFIRREHLGHDQPPVDRCERERLERVKRFLGAGNGRGGDHQRSEEHTSELQSLTNLVCRLLLEKKNHLTKGDGEGSGRTRARTIACQPPDRVTNGAVTHPPWDRLTALYTPIDAEHRVDTHPL